MGTPLFVQISDTHIGFNKEANPDVNGTLDRTIALLNELPEQPALLVVSNTGLFLSGPLDTNESFSYKFEKPGTYRFTCSIHPRMVGTIVVR